MVKSLINLTILVIVLFLILVFSQPFFQEVRYQLERISGVKYQVSESEQASLLAIPEEERTKFLFPPDKEYSVIVPKIGAVARVFADIDPYREKEFLPMLRQGIAQAADTSYPGQSGTTFLFSHSTDAFYNLGRYNTAFYLMTKLKPGDEIDIFYQSKLYKYQVIDSEVVTPYEVDYKDPQEEEKLIVMTCYPAGTTLRRLLVTAIPFE